MNLADSKLIIKSGEQRFIFESHVAADIVEIFDGGLADNSAKDINENSFIGFTEELEPRNYPRADLGSCNHCEEDVEPEDPVYMLCQRKDKPIFVQDYRNSMVFHKGCFDEFIDKLRELIESHKQLFTAKLL